MNHDLVRRWDVYVYLTEYYNHRTELQHDCLKQALSRVPSAEPEIIRCKDCKWYGRADKRRFYRGMDCLQKRIDTIIPDKDFCSRAERREDAETD